MTFESSWAETARVAGRLSSELAEFAVPADKSERKPTEVGPDCSSVDPLTPDDLLLASFDARILDADLRVATRSRFVSKHYADAVETGVKTLNEVVRARSGRHEDGDGLMTVVFSPGKPLLRINPGRSKSDESAQRGHMQLCQGVIAAWRNPRAHTLLNDEPEKALMMLENINELIAVTKAATRTRQTKPKKP